MTNIEKNNWRGCRERGTGVFVLHSTSSPTLLSQVQLSRRLTQRNGHRFVPRFAIIVSSKRFPFFVAFPRFEFIVRSSCFRVSFNMSFPRHLSVFAISYLFGFVAVGPSLHQRSYMYMYLAVNHGWRAGRWIVGLLGIQAGFCRPRSALLTLFQLPSYDSPPVSVAPTSCLFSFIDQSTYEFYRSTASHRSRRCRAHVP